MASEMTVEQLALVPFSFPTYASALGRAAVKAARDLDGSKTQEEDLRPKPAPADPNESPVSDEFRGPPRDSVSANRRQKNQRGSCYERGERSRQSSICGS